MIDPGELTRVRFHAAMQTVTFWLPRSPERREAMARAFEEIARIFRESDPETGGAG